MGRQHVGHADIVGFAEDRVNLPLDKANDFRAQARSLREKLENYLGEHPDFSLKKMLVSGSLAKGTALRSLNDIDVACYISGADAPHDVKKLLDYLAERLRKAFPNFSPDQVQPQTYSVTVSFKGSGLDVDVVPILYSGDPDWYGELVSQDDGSFLKTNIPLHLEFIRKRKAAQDKHFAQVVRLVKYWARLVKEQQDGFRFKSFMIEMIMSKLCDDKIDLSDYPEALQAFFTYAAQTDMRERIAFSDNYSLASIGKFSEPIQIIDPVNATNNVAALYTAKNADAIVDAALSAGDAIDAACGRRIRAKLSTTGRKFLGQRFNRENDMSDSYSVSTSLSFTLTHAKHLAAKYSADLKRLQRFYLLPSDAEIASYEQEMIAYLVGGYLDTLTIGFKRDGNWITPTLRYNARELTYASTTDDDPGKIRPGANISGAVFYSYLTRNAAWDKLSPLEKGDFERVAGISRQGAPQPGVSGYFASDLSYSSGARALDRSTVRSFT